MALSKPQASFDLDELDLRILRELRAVGEVTNKALAQRLHLAESTCAYRIRSLRERGVIRPSPVRLDIAALGHPLQAVIKIRLGSHTKDGVNGLFDALVNTPGVLQVFHVAGEDDFLVHLAVRDSEALRDIVLEQITVHPIVRSTETHLVFGLRDGIGVDPAPITPDRGQ